MRWNGKIIGAMIGLMLGNPLWVIAGIAIGHAFDIGFFQKIFQKTLIRGVQQVQRIFFDSTFSVMGFLAKADGRVTESEIRAVEQIMQQMELNADMRLEAIRLFNQGKQPDFNLSATMQRLKTACWQYPNLLQTFLEMQIQIANAEGGISPGKRRAFQAICAELNIHEFNFEQSNQQDTQSRRSPDAYQVLNISRSATDAEVKKAYRRLLSQNHPDKLMAQGLPPEMIKLANERTHKIKHAYETIMKDRKYASSH
jgi:DnaJ like chaperone protein